MNSTGRGRSAVTRASHEQRGEQRIHPEPVAERRTLGVHDELRLGLDLRRGRIVVTAGLREPNALAHSQR